MIRPEDLLHPTPAGLYCPPGDFYVASPLEQFEVHVLHPLSVGGVNAAFTNASLYMAFAVVGVTLPVLFPNPPRSSTPATAFPIVLLARSREGYEKLCELITAVNLTCPAGVPLDVLRHAGGDHHELQGLTLRILQAPG